MIVAFPGRQMRVNKLPRNFYDTLSRGYELDKGDKKGRDFFMNCNSVVMSNGKTFITTVT